MPRTVNCESLERRHPGLRERLGLESDTALAREYGISRAYVTRIRSGLGISPSPLARAGRPASRPMSDTHVHCRVLSDLRRRWPGTSYELATALKTSPRTLSRWCTGARVPRFETLVAAAQLVDVALHVQGRRITVEPLHGGAGRVFLPAG